MNPHHESSTETRTWCAVAVILADEDGDVAGFVADLKETVHRSAVDAPPRTTLEIRAAGNDHKSARVLWLDSAHERQRLLSVGIAGSEHHWASCVIENWTRSNKAGGGWELSVGLQQVRLKQEETP